MDSKETNCFLLFYQNNTLKKIKTVTRIFQIVQLQKYKDILQKKLIANLWFPKKLFET